MSETQPTEKPHAQKRELTTDICLREQITVRMTNTHLPEFRTANGLSTAGIDLGPSRLLISVSWSYMTDRYGEPVNPLY